MKTECPVLVNERVLVDGVDYAKAFVKSMRWLSEQDRWQIILRWEWIDGTPMSGDGSVVYSSDYGKLFFKYLEVN